MSCCLRESVVPIAASEPSRRAATDNIENDPGEWFPLNPESAEYVQAMATIDAAVVEHKATVKPVPNMMAMGLDPDSKVCCDPQSQLKHPNMPNCTCNPENFDVFVCVGVWPNGCSSPKMSARNFAGGWDEPMRERRARVLLPNQQQCPLRQRAL